MKELNLSKSPINPSLLDSELRSSLGDAFLGLSTRPGEVVLFLEESLSGELLQQAQSIVMNHDASALSPEQQAALERQQALEAGRQANAEPLDSSDFAASAQDVQTLAARLAWLELELRDLRGL